MLNSGVDFSKTNHYAFSIYMQYGCFIRKIIQHSINDNSQVDDILQELFLDLMINPIPDNIKNIKGYLYRTAIKCIAENVRQTTRNADFMNEYAQNAYIAETQENAEADLVSAEETAKMFTLMRKQLSQQEFTAITMYYRESRTVKEIAASMGVDTASVRRYINRAYARIRDSFAAEEVYAA